MQKKHLKDNASFTEVGKEESGVALRTRESRGKDLKTGTLRMEENGKEEKEGETL